MNINLFIDRNFLYEYECFFIKELLHEFQSSKIVLKFEEKGAIDFSPRKSLYDFIDHRLTNFKKNSWEKLSIKEVGGLFPNLDITSGSETSVSDFSIFFYQIENPFQKTKSENIFSFTNRIEDIEKATYSSCDFLTIEIFKFDHKNFVWKEINSLSVTKDKGIKNNINKAYFYASILLLKTVRQIVEHAPVQIHKEQNSNYSSGSKLSYYFRLFMEIIRRKFFSKKTSWKLAFKIDSGYQFIEQDKNEFWADPFGVCFEGKNYVFFEKMNCQTNLGEIAYVEFNKDFDVVSQSIVLKNNFHFSFPNLFQWNNEWYMMPETSANNEVAIYKAEKFPKIWKKDFVIFENVKLLDSIWLQHNGLYYLFANKVHNFEHDNNERLYIYYSEDLFSQNWKSHAQNPVVINLQGSRNAGKIYKENGKIYRPSQDCKKYYGNRVYINEIIELSPINFVEKRVESIDAPTFYLGLHTYNVFNEKMALVDILYDVKKG